LKSTTAGRRLSNRCGPSNGKKKQPGISGETGSDYNGGEICSACGSRHTRLKVNYGHDQADYIKTWRGQRFLTYHCQDCGSDFSVAAAGDNLRVAEDLDNREIDDEEALREAEEALKRATDENGDHRYN